MKIMLSLLGAALLFVLSCSAETDSYQALCRYTATTPLAVNYYTCTQFADYYGISIEKFFKLNPTIDLECSNIQPDTEYCVAGYFAPPVSTDGYCGPNHGNTTCVGTDKQCCNANTWTCGDSSEDCAAGTCYEGDCNVVDPTLYSLDGRCGPDFDDKICTGVWGNCCNMQGFCGSGASFCAESKCHSGACTQQPMSSDFQWHFGTSPNGTCGGSEGYTCDVVVGGCCNKDNRCGSHAQDCGVGCQPQFGRCDSPTPTSSAQPATTSGVSPDGSCGGTRGYTCKGSAHGDCCSSSGFCGGTSDFCNAGCQSAFGLCKNPDMSPDGSCGGSKGYSCEGFSTGECCGSSGFCGSSPGHCGAGCQAGFGGCTPGVSPDGSCGGTNGYKCVGSGFGDCCSSSGYCGSSDDFCEAGCQMKFGKCTRSGVPILVWDAKSGTYDEPKAPAPVVDKHSRDGSCGGTKGYTCAGANYGGCCSKDGFCGSSVTHCAQGCQKKFANDCLTENVPTLDGNCGPSKDGLTCAGGPFDGQCCSAGGWCGSTDAHCSSGCQKGFGKCN